MFCRPITSGPKLVHILVHTLHSANNLKSIVLSHFPFLALGFSACRRQIVGGEDGAGLDHSSRPGQQEVFSKTQDQHKGGPAIDPDSAASTTGGVIITAAEREKIFHRLPAQERQVRMYESCCVEDIQQW